MKLDKFHERRVSALHITVHPSEGTVTGQITLDGESYHINVDEKICDKILSQVKQGNKDITVGLYLEDE